MSASPECDSISRIPLSLYIHLPWCVRKCPYCDFNSHEVRSELPEHAYIEALLTDLEYELVLVGERRVSSIFIGGGTPSLFSARALDELLSHLNKRLNFIADCEITLEANPGTAEQQKFKDYRTLGINRLSIGVQSLNTEHLQVLGRIHGRHEAFSAIEAAHNAGFDNFNIDLMFALPQQSVDQALADLREACALSPSHLSHYQLTLEPNTRFYKYPPALPDDDTIWQMQQECQQYLAQLGYQHYEISAYAQPGRRCQHNLNYWQFGDYIGIGAGAHGKLTTLNSDGTLLIQRRYRVKNPKDYLKHIRNPERLIHAQSVAKSDYPLEFMLNALRLVDGVPAAYFSERTGLKQELLASMLMQARQKGLMTNNPERLQATTTGLNFLNELLQLFMPEEPGNKPDNHPISLGNQNH